MEKSMLHFGAGNHLCLGRNISVREMYELVYSLMRTFKVSIPLWAVVVLVKPPLI